MKYGMKDTQLETVYQFRNLPWPTKVKKSNANQRIKAKAILEKLFL